MSRITPRAAIVAAVAVLILAACGSDEKSASTTATQATTPDSVVVANTATGVSTATAETITGDTITGDTITGDTITGESSAAPVTADESGGDTGAKDPAITALADLDGDAMCALIPAADVATIIGVDPGEPTSDVIPGLSTGCSYLVEIDGNLVGANIAITPFSWSINVAAAANPGDGSEPPSVPCTVGGKDALCLESGEVNGITFPATVTVKLGGDEDYTMEADGEDLSAAQALAELALSNLPV